MLEKLTFKSQIAFLPECFDVTEDNSVAVIEAFFDALDRGRILFAPDFMSVFYG